MKQISEEQIQTIINKLAEAPAKFVFDVIIELQKLEDIKEKQTK